VLCKGTGGVVHEWGERGDLARLFGRNGIPVFIDDLHWGVEAIPGSRDGDNVLRLARVLSEKAAKIVDLLGQVGLVDGLIQPDLRDQIFLGDDLPRVSQQHHQHFEFSSGQRKRGAIPEKFSGLHLQLKRPKPIPGHR